MSYIAEPASHNVDLYRYAGSRLAMAELYAAVDFDEPARVSRALAHPIEREAFEQGRTYAYQYERSLPEPKGGKAFFSALCREAQVS